MELRAFGSEPVLDFGCVAIPSDASQGLVVQGRLTFSNPTTKTVNIAQRPCKVRDANGVSWGSITATGTAVPAGASQSVDVEWSIPAEAL